MSKMEDCTAEVSKEWYKKEYQKLFEENHKLKVIIDLLIEELHRRLKKMTKLEEKLIKLGYEIERDEEYTEDCFIACKDCNAHADIVIGVSENKIYHYYVYTYLIQHIRRQDQIDNLQLAFNEMQKDLEVLKSVED